MRIAVYHNLPSGGGKRALQEMVKRLAGRHSLDVYSLSTANHEFCDLRPYCQGDYVFPFKPLPGAKSPFGRLNQGIRSIDLLRLMHVQRLVAKQIDARGYDVAFVHNCQYSQSPALLRFLRTPSAYYCGEPPRQIYEPAPLRPYYRFSKWQRAGNAIDPLPYVYRKTLRNADITNVQHATSVLVNSAFTRETLYRVYGILADVCYLGVDACRFKPLNLAKENFILSVGALQAKKGFDLLIAGLALIPPKQRPLLVIVSNAVEQREKQFLSGLAQRHDVTVEFQAGISDDDLASLYNRALLTVYTPLMEPFGFVAIESMACGTPVVGVNEGGLRESVINGETGLLVDRDPESVASAVMQLLSNDERRREYGCCGREHVLRRWQWDSAVERLDHYLLRTAAMQTRNT